MKTNRIILGVAFLVLIATSCRKEEIIQPAIPKPDTMNELTASASFDWKTSKEFQFTINGDQNSVVKIVSEKGYIYHKGFVKSNTPYKINVIIPTYEKTIHVMYFGKNVEYSLNQSDINCTINTKQ